MQKFVPFQKALAAPLTGLAVVLSTYAIASVRLSPGLLPVPLFLGAGTGLFIYAIYWIIPATRYNANLSASITTLAVLVWMLFPLPVIATGCVLIAVMIAVKSNWAQDFMKVWSVGLTAVMLVSIGQIIYYRASDSSIAAPVSTINSANVYFIIPDRFPSISAMHELGIDTTEFEDTMAALGFTINPNMLSRDTIKPDSKAVPTTRTLRYLVSVLNWGVDVPVDISYNKASAMVKQHAVGAAFIASGYDYYHIGSWFAETSVNPQASYNYKFVGYSFMDLLFDNELSLAIIDNSLWRYLNMSAVLPDKTLAKVEYNRATGQAGDVKRISGLGGKKFVFAHILMPHPPYVFDSAGNLQQDYTLTAQDAYKEQMIYGLTYVIEMAQAIRANDPDAIVIIQSDEGMCYTKPELNTGLTNNQWNGLLSAWYVPGNTSGVESTGILEYIRR